MFRLYVGKSVGYPLQIGSRFRSALARVAWCALLALHAWVLGKALAGGSASFSSLLLLTVSNAFFLLKLFDVSFLRFHWTRRSVIAAALVVLLIHVGAIDTKIGHEFDPTPWLMVKMSPLALLFGWLGRILAMAGAALALAVLVTSRAHTLIAFCNTVAADVQRRLCHSLVLSLIASRPPPSA